MGEARRRLEVLKPLTDSERAEALGSDPFKLAFDLLHGMVQAVFKATGGINHELIGVDFEAGQPKGVNVLVVKRLGDVARLRGDMLVRYPMVAHIFEAWAAPDGSAPPSSHPGRYDVISIGLYTTDIAAFAQNRVDVASRVVARGELIYPDRIDGRFAFDLPQRH